MIKSQTSKPIWEGPHRPPLCHISSCTRLQPCSVGLGARRGWRPQVGGSSQPRLRTRPIHSSWRNTPCFWGFPPYRRSFGGCFGQAAGCRLLGLQVVPSQPADMTIDTQRQMWQRDGQDARTDAQARPRVLIPFRSFTSCSVIASLPSVGHSLTEAADLEASTVDRTGEQPCGLRVRWAQRRHEPRKGSVSV